MNDIIDLGIGITLPGMEDFRLVKKPEPEKVALGGYLCTLPNENYTIEVIDQLPDGTVVYRTDMDGIVHEVQMNLSFFKQVFTALVD